MSTFLWVIQSLIALTFLVSGILQLISTEEELVAKGFSGVEGLLLSLILFIGISEIFGAVGIIVPLLFDISPVLTIVSVLSLAPMMVASAFVNYQYQDYKKIIPVIIIFLICTFISFERFIFNF